MTIRRKTLLIVALALAFLVTVLYCAFQNVVLKGFARLEEQFVRRNVERALDALENNIATLDGTAVDWAAWDDTYVFVQDANAAYVRANLSAETFKNLRINHLLIVDSSARTVFGRSMDAGGERVLPVPESLKKHLAAGGPLLSGPGTGSGVAGLLVLPEGPVLVASRPILTSTKEGPARGSLIIGRWLDAGEIERLAAITHLSLAVHSIRDAAVPADFVKARTRLTGDAPVFVSVLDDRSVAGYALVKDIYGKPALIMRVHMPRDIYRQGQATVGLLVLSLLAVGLVFSGVMMILLDRAVLSRVARLSRDVGEITAAGDSSLRLAAAAGQDELSGLAREINGMLKALDASRQEIKERESRLHLILDSINCGTVLIDEDEHRIVDVNRAALEMIGAPREEIIGRVCHEFICPAEKGKCPITDLGQDVDRSERVLITAQGRRIPIIKSAVPLILKGKKYLLESFLDITERKRMEEQLKYLSLHDSLTGLYNRTYFEQEMRRLADGRHAPVGLIICDLDALKFVNDTMGHDAGDALLAATADVLRKCFRAGDMVARIGGDEFAVLLPNSDQEAVQAACLRIEEAVAEYNSRDPEIPLSISIGFAVGGEGLNDLNELFKEADNNMYRAKLQRNEGTRGAAVKILLKALEEKDFITGGHAERLQALVIALGKAVGVPKNRLKDLRLLAQFHDIGKVGIPDGILFKPGPLTAEETAEIRRHAEIGYRIAQSMPDLVLIADWILKHHEWWNGEGYPLGLKGEEIPLECRILAIADAYDAMTSDRPYRKAMSREEALAELQKGAGKQFDPELVRKFVHVLTKPHQGPLTF
ncbi:MAG: HD domain-containing phosphohydrolase [Bacillota bacterium]|uniref:diguanylate cyclase domain-containing protein n=1 Tax=Desulforudis sp. DRI-14 TaxID=3459793 RepID=UPI00347414BE